MAELVEERSDVRQRRRAPADPRRGASRPKQNRTLVLTDATWEKLGVAAGRKRMDRSAYAEDLLSGALSHLVIQDRGRTSLEGVSAIQANEVRESSETLPAGETLTPSELVSSDPPGGEGEGSEIRPAGGRRRRGAA